MMNWSDFSNSTPPSCHCKWRSSVYCYVQIPLGAGAALLNLTIVITILRYQALRQKYLLIMALAWADALEGLATLAAGIYRSTSLIEGWACECISRLHCMVLPQAWLWRWTELATAFMLLAVSCDRFISVKWPFKHYVCGVKYSKRMIAFVYSLATINMLYGWIYPIRTRNTLIVAFCSSSATVEPNYYQFDKYFASFGSFLSVLVFALIVVQFQIQNRAKVSDMENDHKVQKREIKRYERIQRRLTVTLAISSVCTLVLDTIPRAYGIYLHFSPRANFLGRNSVYLFRLTKLNAMANFVIYAIRQIDIRFGLKALVQCKDLPQDVEIMAQNRTASLCSRKSAESHCKPNSTLPKF